MDVLVTDLEENRRLMDDNYSLRVDKKKIVILQMCGLFPKCPTKSMKKLSKVITEPYLGLALQTRSKIIQCMVF